MSKARLFVSIDVSAEIADHLLATITDYKKSIPANIVRWTTRERMHMTLRFLGDMAVDQIAPITTALQAVPLASFELQLSEIGCFPDCRKPRVVWAGVRGELETLHTLRHDVDAALLPFGGKQDDFGFNPHITLGYVRKGQQLKPAVLRLPKPLSPLLLTVDSIHLMQSTQSPNGPIYTSLAEIS